jgi:hypothetical protein
MPHPLLQDLQRELAEVAPLTVVMAAGVGLGLTQLLVGPIGQASDLALEAVSLIGLQVFAPVGVVLVWLSRTAPLQVARPRPWWRHLSGAALIAMALWPWFMAALILAGMLATPRDDLASELDRLIGSLDPPMLLVSLIRTAILATAAAAVCQRKARQLHSGRGDLPRGVADAITEAYLLTMLLEVGWISVIDPFRIQLR